MGRKHPLAKCEECPLEDQPYVPSLIPEGRARLAVVGEAPGFRETAYKEPFKGPSGQLLDKVLQYHGYSREEVLYTNVTCCRPEDNATPPATAQAACRARLVDEINSARVRDVIALGGTAVSNLVDDPRKITALRIGPPKRPAQPLRDAGVERVVPTWHPAYCLRNPDAFPTLVTDIEKVKHRHLEEWREPEWTYSDEVALAKEWLRWLMEWQDQNNRYELVVDIEVGIEKDTAFDHPNMYELLCIGFAWDKGKAHVVEGKLVEDPEVKFLLYQLLKRSKLIAHNGKFDLAGLYPLFKSLVLWFDTMLAHYALDERTGGHGLKVLAVERLGAPSYDDEIKKYIPKGGSYANIPRPILYRYNALDVACTWNLYELFTAELDADPNDDWPYPDVPVRTLRDWHDFLVAASNQLMYLELNGIAVDRQYNSDLEDSYIQRLGNIEEGLDAIVSLATKGEVSTINPRSPKQVKEFLHRQGFRVEKTDKEVLEALVDRTYEDSDAGKFVRELLRHRYESKRYGTFVKGIRKRMYGGRVYTTYLLHGTTSGRLASRNPNLQNIVRDKAIRRQFVATKQENVLIQADYKQAEGRVVAWLAQDQYLRDVFADPNADLFNELGSKLYRCPVEQLDKEMRVRTKAYFYGLSYGREAYSIAKEYDLPVGEVKRDLEDFFAMIPNVRPWQEEIKQRVRDGKDLISPFGRRRRFALITRENEKDVYNEALSYLPQSTASDICLSALMLLRPKLKGIGFIRLTIHDALVVECNRERVEEVSAMLRREMVEAASRLTTYVPFEVDVSVGDSWGDLS